MTGGQRLVDWSRRGRVLALGAVGIVAVGIGLGLSKAHATRYIQAPNKDLPSGGQGSASAKCPGGTHVVGGGQHVFSGFDEATLNTSTPIDGRDSDRAPDDGWKSTVDSFDQQNTLTVWVICASKKPSYEKHAVRVGGLQNITGKTRCDSGDRVSGGGVRLPVSFDDDAWLRSSAPLDSGDGGSRPDDGWTATGTVGERNVDMTITAICVSQALQYRAERVDAPPNDSTQAYADCPPGGQVLGGGVSVAEGALGNAMTISRPFDDVDANATPDDGWVGEFDNFSLTDPGRIKTFAICQT